MIFHANSKELRVKNGLFADDAVFAGIDVMER